MKLAYRPNCGHILIATASKTRLDSLTASDAQGLMFGSLKYDRRKSFSKPKNRLWADGVDWK